MPGSSRMAATEAGYKTPSPPRKILSKDVTINGEEGVRSALGTWNGLRRNSRSRFSQSEGSQGAKPCVRWWADGSHGEQDSPEEKVIQKAPCRRRLRKDENVPGKPQKEGSFSADAPEFKPSYDDGYRLAHSGQTAATGGPLWSNAFDFAKLEPPPGLSPVCLQGSGWDTFGASGVSQEVSDTDLADGQPKPMSWPAFIPSVPAMYSQCEEHVMEVSASTLSLLKLLQEALASLEAKRDPESCFIPLARLLRGRNELMALLESGRGHEGGTGGLRIAATRLVEEITNGDLRSYMQLDKTKRRVRFLSAEEVIRIEAKRMLDKSRFGLVPLNSILSSKMLEPFLPKKDAECFVKSALDHEDSSVIVRDVWAIRRPSSAQLKRCAEELFSEANISQDSRLRSKIAIGPDGEIPLAWITTRYTERLGLKAPPQGDALAVEAMAVEVCCALADSEVLLADPRRLTVRFRGSRDQAGKDSWVGSVEGEVAAHNSKLKESKLVSCGTSGRGTGSSRAATQLRQLLDFYFEPFTLQNNRYLLDLVAKKLGTPHSKGPWLPQELSNLSFSVEELRGLGRIEASLTKLHINCDQDIRDVLCFNEGGAAKDGPLRHLICGEDGTLRIRSNVEIRSFVQAPWVPNDIATGVAQYLYAARESRGKAPKGIISVMSYNVNGVFSDATLLGTQRQARVKRQLLLHQTDLVCLQGIDSEGLGAHLAASLAEEGYGFVSARSFLGEANTIFWDRTRWEMVNHQDCEGALAVILSPYEDLSMQVRVVCFQPKMVNTFGSHLGHLFGSFDPNGLGPLIACTDLSVLGGAQSAGLVHELLGLPSVAEELLGEEIAVPMTQPRSCSGAILATQTATGLNRLHSPDGIFFRDVTPVTMLSGHKKEYLMNLPREDIEKHFPASRLPIVAAFDWRVAYSQLKGSINPTPNQRIRL